MAGTARVGCQRTVVTPQDGQRARRGRRQRNCPPKPRRERVRACPHGASEEPQPHRNRPARSAASTIVGSPFTTFVTLRSSFHGSYRRSAGSGAEGATRVEHWPPRPGRCNPGHSAADRGRTDQQPGRTNSVIVDEHQPCSPAMTPTTLPIPTQQGAQQLPGGPAPQSQGATPTRMPSRVTAQVFVRGSCPMRPWSRTLHCGSSWDQLMGCARLAGPEAIGPTTWPAPGRHRGPSVQAPFAPILPIMRRTRSGVSGRLVTRAPKGARASATAFATAAGAAI